MRALSANGVGEEAIAGIRRDLGLAPDGAMDLSLAKRSIKPLSRQQIRTILDQNAEAINNIAGPRTIQTYDQLHARYTQQHREDIIRTRNDTNAALIRSRATLPDRAIQDAQAVISGDVHFRTAEERNRLIAAAVSVKERILARSEGGVPSEDPGATVRFRRDADGFNVTFALGGSDADALKRLDDVLVLLRHDSQPADATFAVRNEFRLLDGAEAKAKWVANLPNHPYGAFKARTVAMGILFECGINDWATLSLVNRITDFAAIALVSDLVNHRGNLRGDALRQSPIVANLAGYVDPQPINPDQQAFVPVLSPVEYRKTIREGANGNDSLLTHEMKVMRNEVLADLRTRFGADIIPANISFQNVVTEDVFNRAFGDVGNGAPRRTRRTHPLRRSQSGTAGPCRSHRETRARALRPLRRRHGRSPPRRAQGVPDHARPARRCARRERGGTSRKGGRNQPRRCGQ